MCPHDGVSFLARLLNVSSRPDPDEEKEVDEKLEAEVLRLANLGGEALTSIPVVEAVRFLVDLVLRSSSGVVLILASGFESVSVSFG